MAVAASTGFERCLAFALLVEVGELVGAQQEFLALGGIGMAGGVGVVDGLLHGAGLGCGEESAFLFHREEQLPSFFSQRAGEFLHKIGTAGHVHDFVEVAFFLQQELLVAGDALSKVGRGLVGCVERGHHDRVHARQGGTHGFRLAAEHVDVAVEHRHIISSSGGIDLHLASTVAELVLACVLAVLARAYRFVLLDDVGPQHAGCAELGDFHEVNAADAEIELDFLGGQRSRDAGFHHLREILVAPCQRVAQFLVGVSTRVAERVGIHRDATELRERCQHLYQFGQLSEERRGVLALGENLLHGVEADAARERFRVVALLVEISGQQLGQFQCVSLAGAEVQFHCVGLDAFEQGGDEVRAELLAGHFEAQRSDAFVQQVECLGVGLAGICRINVLAHVPAVVVFLVASQVGKLAGQGVGLRHAFEIFAAVKRFHVEPFVGPPHHFLLIVRSLQIHLDFVHPFLAGKSSKTFVQGQKNAA